MSPDATFCPVMGLINILSGALSAAALGVRILRALGVAGLALVVMGARPMVADATLLGDAPIRYESQDRVGWRIFAKDATTRDAVVNLYKSVYLPGKSAALSWTGSVSDCVAGATNIEHQQATIERINYYRALVNLPALTLLTGVPTTQAQAAALISAANWQLSHAPPTNWLCYSADGAAGAGSSNLALGMSGPGAIDGYMGDGGSNNTAVGHRRWILYPPRASMATGDTSAPNAPSSNALYVFGPTTTRPATPNGVAWPPAGYVPYQNLPAGSNRWSFSYPGANFTNATVTINGPSGSIPVTYEPLANGYGDNTIVFLPERVSYAKPTVDTAYSIQISNVAGAGVPTSFHYTVTVIDPKIAPTAPTVMTGAASAIGAHEATLNGTLINSNGASTTAWFEYGIDTTYGMTTGSLGLSEEAMNVFLSAPLGSGLACSYQYHFRLVAANSAGTAYGSDVSFTTATCASQSIAFGAAPNVVVGSSGAVSASATSGLAVTFSSLTPSICTVSGSTVTGVTAATCTIAANQAGNVNFNAAPQATQSFSIGKGSQAALVVSAVPASLVFNGTASLSTTGGSGTGALTYAVTAGPCSVTGNILTGTGVGTCNIRATKAGDSNYNIASGTATVPVGKANQSITFGGAPSLAIGIVVEVSASATSGLAVTLSSLTPSICTISGSTVAGVAVGTCTIAANQAGNVNFNAAPQATQSFSIGKGSQAALVVSAVPASLVFNGTASLSTTGGSGTGALTYAVTAGPCSVTGNILTGTGVGTCTIRATKAGDSNYNIASGTATVPVGKANQSITFGAAPSASVGSSGAAKATATSGLAVTFSSVTPSICSVSGSTVTSVAVGACTITANQVGNVNFNAAPQATQSFTVVDVLSGVLAANPAFVDFGDQLLNIASLARGVVIDNIGSNPVTVNTVTGTPHFAVAHNCSVLAVGASCTASVTFTPTAEGGFTGDLTISSSAGIQTVPLTGGGERSLVTHYYRSILRRDPEPQRQGVLGRRADHACSPGVPMSTRRGTRWPRLSCSVPST